MSPTWTPSTADPPAPYLSAAVPDRGASGPVAVSGAGDRAVRPDGQEWVDGRCWRCDDYESPVMWIGDAQNADFGHAPIYFCEQCARRFTALIRAHALGTRPPPPSRAPSAPAAGEHNTPAS